MRFGGFIAALALITSGVQAQGIDLSGELSLQSRWYADRWVSSGEHSSSRALIVKPTLRGQIGVDSSIEFTPLFRYDSTENKSTHTDVREAYLLTYGDWDRNSWELRLGISRVFWGVAEVHNLVDVVNQIDLIDHPRDRPKLGQPMAHLTIFGDWGMAEAFVLPYHRPRSYSGRLGSIPTARSISEIAQYESGAEEHHVDFALRYSHAVGLVDFGFSSFFGTSREPTFDAPQDMNLPITPYYEKIRQFGIEAQITTESNLFKMEAIHRNGQRNRLGREESYNALVLGMERAVYAPFGSKADLTLVTEWLYDSRGQRTTGIWQKDLYVAGFLTLNDVHGTELSAGIVKDLDSGERSWNMEFKRRLSNNWSIRLEALDDLFMGMNLTFSF